MKITIHELLGLVKDGKAPKKIKTNTGIFKLEIEDDQLNYRCNDGGILTFDYYIENNKLSDEIEIIEEDKKIEKANIKLFENTGEAILSSRIEEYNENNFKELKRVTDELIDEVNKLKEGNNNENNNK